MQKNLTSLYRWTISRILSNRDTRNLFFFLLLNLLFAFVELFYGLLTNSLGLISDSFHMFFDCSALLLGLAASLITKRSPNDSYSYGFGRAEVLTGLANGLFLLFIAFFIMKEAIERTFEPPEVHHEKLFVISVLGFFVNLVGIFVFQHGGQCSHNHSHNHASDSCSHSHPSKYTHEDDHHRHDHDHSRHGNSFQEGSHEFSHFSSPTIDHHHHQGIVTLDMNGFGKSGANDRFNHRNTHVHDGVEDDNGGYSDKARLMPHSNTSAKRTNRKPRGQIMQSVLLHIIADTLGSVGVMISAILMNQFGWLIADPLCSLFIAILISISVYPLLKDSIHILMQRVPVELETKIPTCLHRIQSLPGVISLHDIHFWTLTGDIYVGSLKLEVAHGASQRNILESTKVYLDQMGVDKYHIQIDQV